MQASRSARSSNTDRAFDGCERPGHCSGLFSCLGSSSAIAAIQPRVDVRSSRVLPTRAVAKLRWGWALYASQIRTTSKRCSQPSQIAAAWGRVGDARRLRRYSRKGFLSSDRSWLEIWVRHLAKPPSCAKLTLFILVAIGIIRRVAPRRHRCGRLHKIDRICGFRFSRLSLFATLPANRRGG